MDKCREAFEQLPEIKDSLSENIVFLGNKYTTAKEGFYDLVNWLNGGWYIWQSRQVEVDLINATHDGQMIGHDVFVKQLKERHEKQVDSMTEALLNQTQLLAKQQAEVDELFQENTRLKYLVGEKIGHPSARDLLDAEVQRQFDEQTLSSDKEFMTDEEIENLIKDVLKDHDENPNKYWPNLFKQIDDLKADVDEKDKRIEELESRLNAVMVLSRMRAAVVKAENWSKLRPHIKNAIKCLDRKEKALRGERE